MVDMTNSRITLTDTIDLFRAATHVTVTGFGRGRQALRHRLLDAQRQITRVEGAVVILPGEAAGTRTALDLAQASRVEIDRFGNLTLRLPGDIEMTVRLERLATAAHATAA